MDDLKYLSPYMLIAAIAGLAVNVAVVAQDQESEPSSGEPDASVTAPGESDIDGSEAPPADESDEFGASEGAAAASNPLASVSKIDLRFDYFDVDGADRFDYNVKGDLMLHPRLKLVYEAHYWSTNITDRTEDGWDRVSLKPIFFVDDVELTDTWQMRVAAGFEWILDGDNTDKGIGSGSDQVAPLLGFAFNNRDTGLTLIPLVQQFMSYDGPSVNTTAFRLIALKPLPDSMWLRLDTRIPYDWQNDAVPASFELEFGKMFTPNLGVYGTGFIGIGGDKTYDHGLGAGLRITF